MNKRNGFGFWVIVALGLFFAVGTLIYAFQEFLKGISDGITPISLIAFALTIILHPAWWLGVVLLIWAWRINKKTAQNRGAV